MQTKKLLQARFEHDLKASGLRATHVRQKLFDALRQTSRPLSIQELVDLAENVHFVSVYRSIDALHKAGIVKQVPQGFKHLFELSDTYRPHHHHATCEHCGRSVSVHNDNLEQLLIELTVQSGLTPTKHTFELFGVCSACKELAV